MVHYLKAVASYIASRYILPDMGVIAVSESSVDRVRDWFERLSRRRQREAPGSL